MLFTQDFDSPKLGLPSSDKHMRRLFPPQIEQSPVAPSRQPPPYFDAPYIEPCIPETQPIMSADVAEAVRPPLALPPIAPVKPEPLAGPNVMKVVLVGAECAPWSKTGA